MEPSETFDHFGPIISKNEAEGTDENEGFQGAFSSKALQMMKLMGYKFGSGLGKDEQGITAPINVNSQLGKRGLGLKVPQLEPTDETWDFDQEDTHIEEVIEWLNNTGDFNILEYNLDSWIKENPPLTLIEDQNEFCDPDILKNVVKAKEIFDELDIKELNQARTRANPFETIRSVFFINRAALKMANIDAATDFMFSNIDQNLYHQNDCGLIYFADVCAGPGGFTEYILWRKNWKYKGFGFTLRGDNDFNLKNSLCASDVTFHPFYGVNDDGDVCCPENIEDFSRKVLHETEGKGVHFMMSDGGFSVDGNENLQEILSKNIYICQCLVALKILRSHGHFVTKLFDVFTCFSVGLLFLMSKCFEKVCILKPNSSRPANSERYFIATNYIKNDLSKCIQKYLTKIVEKLWSLRDKTNIDITEIIPLEIIKKDKLFYEYIFRHNNKIAKYQTIHLKKLAAFCRNPTLVDERQTELRSQCLEYWKIPDIKLTFTKFTSQHIPMMIYSLGDLLMLEPKEYTSQENLKNAILNLKDWHFAAMQSVNKTNKCNFYIGLTYSKVYKLSGGKWVKVKNLELASGTLLYGEIVREKIVKVNGVIQFKYALHVIDAIRLGNQNLENFTFEERLKLISTYCSAINNEFKGQRLRLRPKIIRKLETLSDNCLTENEPNGNYYSILPTLTYAAIQDSYEVNSILLLKTDEKESFHSTYILRLQLSILRTDKGKNLPFGELLDFIKCKLQQ